MCKKLKKDAEVPAIPPLEAYPEVGPIELNAYGAILTFPTASNTDDLHDGIKDLGGRRAATDTSFSHPVAENLSRL